MSHPNIYERQEYVKNLLDAGVRFNQVLLENVAAKFTCHVSAVRADIKTLTKDPSIPTMHTSQSLRNRVRERDGRVCQYCGSKDVNKDYVIEHVIPAPLGPARPYNLVVACQNCNVKKGRNVWLPRNLEQITQEHSQWRERIVELAASKQLTFIGFTEDVV